MNKRQGLIQPRISKEVSSCYRKMLDVSSVFDVKPPVDGMLVLTHHCICRRFEKESGHFGHDWTYYRVSQCIDGLRGEMRVLRASLWLLSPRDLPGATIVSSRSSLVPGCELPPS